jgi:signal transduction histidine kinase
MPEVTHEQPTPTSPEGWRFGARSFRTKIVATTVALMAAAMLVVGLGIQLLLARTAQGDVDGVLVDRAAAMITVVDQASKGGVVTVPQASLSPGVLVYTSDGVLVAGSVEPEAREQAERLSRTTTPRFVHGPDDKTRLLGKPFTTSRGVKGVVVVSAETAPYERSERYALVATAVLGALVVAASALIALRVTRTALRPVAQMAERAADWSEHDLEHRFDLGPPTNELAALGGILDRLLDRVASVILAEQRLTAELAHELRTPLTSIKGSADLALMRGVEDPEVRRELEQISQSAQSMAGVITTLLDISRDGAAQSTQRSCLAADVLGDVASDAALAARAGVTVTVDGAASAARIPAPRELVVRAVQPLVDNAVRHAASRVVLAATDRGDWVELSVADDGPGIAPQARERLFEPGVSERAGGAGLGLGIARRVARSLGGDVTVQPPAGGDLGGARFVVALPRR